MHNQLATIFVTLPCFSNNLHQKYDILHETKQNCTSFFYWAECKHLDHNINTQITVFFNYFFIHQTQYFLFPIHKISISVLTVKDQLSVVW